jgi:hypothetical protein
LVGRTKIVPIHLKDQGNMSQPARSAREWFAEAARCYTEKHQACPWCHASNCVYRSERDDLVEFHCGECEFYAFYEPKQGHHYMGPGEKHQPRAAPPTMLGIELGL